MADDELVVIGKNARIESKILDEARTLVIAEPQNYRTEPDEKFPVLYLLDGPGNFHHTTGAVNFLAQNGRIPHMIVIGVGNTDRARDLTPPTLDLDEKKELPTAGGADTFLNFTADELIPWVDKNYRTRSYRLLTGHSFGGLLALHSLITRPDLFNSYLAISPSLWWSHQGLVEQANTFFSERKRLSKDLFMTMGDEGGAMLGGVRKLAGVLDEHAPADFRWNFRRMNEENHGSIPYRSTYYGLESIFDGWRLADPVSLYDQGGVKALTDYFKPIAKRLGYERNMPLSTMNELCSTLTKTARLDDAASIITYDPENHPIFSGPVEQLADAYRKLDDSVAALKYYQLALSLAPGRQNIGEKIRELGAEPGNFEAHVDPEELELFAATYGIDGTQDDAVVTFENGKLFCVEPVTGGPKRQMVPMVDGRFYIDESPLLVSFQRDTVGMVALMTIHMGGRTRIRQRRP
jgi:predicted alpha/beta superfamily hydrolase